MALNLSTLQLAALKSPVKEPNIILKIDGFSTILAASKATRFTRIGDPLLEIGDPTTDADAFYVGAYSLVNDQENIVTPDGTSTSIRQSLDIAQGKATSIQNISISILDDGLATRLISPGVILDDILERKCLVYYGFNQTAFPDDYSIIFRGRISDVTADAGKVTFQISAPDAQKATDIFKKIDSKLTGAINDSTTSIPIDTTSGFLQKISMPDGSFDPAFESFVRIDDEIIKYDTILAGVLTGVTRGALNSTAAAHDSGATASSYYQLKDNGVFLGLKLMASGQTDLGASVPILADLPVTSINIGGSERASNSLFFRDTRVGDVYGLTVGDWLSVSSGASDGANNVTAKLITDIIKGIDGDFVVIGGVSFIDDVTSDGIIASFISQYATLPDGCRMGPDEIDVDEHLRIYRLFLTSVNYTFYIKNGIPDGRAFLEQDIYRPMAAYSLPRKARASMGYNIGPIPGSNIKTFGVSNIKNPESIRVKRSINTDFYNEILYQYDEDAVLDQFNSGFLAISQVSKTRIKGSPNKTLIIPARGLRTTDLGASIASAQADRRLKRYQYGAESFTFSTLLEDGFEVEIGDIAILDGSGLFIPDSVNAIRGLKPRLLEIQDKQFQLKTGDIQFVAVDTKFSAASRYGLISPSSIIQSGLSTTQFLIRSSYSARFGAQEFKKWQGLSRPAVKIRSADFSTVAESVIVSASSNQITVSPALGFTPSAGQVMELADYDSALTSDQVKLIYAYMKNTAFADGKSQFVML